MSKSTIELETDYREAVARTEEVQRRLSSVGKEAPEREAIKTELQAATTRVRDAKEALKQHGMMRNFAGLMSPLWEAVLARLDAATAAELEADAIARQEERTRRGAERRAAKAAATPAPAALPPPAPPPPPRAAPTKPAQPEVIYARSRSAPQRYPFTSDPPRSNGLRAEVAGAFADARRART